MTESIFKGTRLSDGKNIFGNLIETTYDGYKAFISQNDAELEPFTILPEEIDPKSIRRCVNGYAICPDSWGVIFEGDFVDAYLKDRPGEYYYGIIELTHDRCQILLADGTYLYSYDVGFVYSNERYSF